MGGHHIRRLIAYPNPPTRNFCVVDRLARFGLYHILQVTDPVRGRMELRYVRGWPEPLTVQLGLFQ